MSDVLVKDRDTHARTHAPRLSIHIKSGAMFLQSRSFYVFPISRKSQASRHMTDGQTDGAQGRAQRLMRLPMQGRITIRPIIVPLTTVTNYQSYVSTK